MILSEAININPVRKTEKGSSKPFFAMDDIKINYRYVKSKTYRNTNSGSKFKNGDTLLARITPSLENGKTAYVDSLEEGQVGLGSTEFIVMCGKPGITENLFVYYIVRTPEFRKAAIQSMTGTSGRQRVQESVFDNYEIEIFDQDTQLKITNILGIIDDKIKNLKESNMNLEKTILTIFKSCFIDFDGQTEFVDSELGKIPKEWEVKNFGDIVTITDFGTSGSFASLKQNIKFYYYPEYAILIRSIDFTNNWNGNYVYTDKHGYDFSKKGQAKSGDIFLSNIGNVGTPFFAPDLNNLMLCGKNILLIKTEQIKKNFLFSYLQSNVGQISLESIRTGSTVPKFNKTDLKNTKIIVPIKNELEKFERVVGPIRKQIQKTEKLSKNLTKIRNSLLPKLMSGEIKVLD